MIGNVPVHYIGLPEKRNTEIQKWKWKFINLEKFAMSIDDQSRDFGAAKADDVSAPEADTPENAGAEAGEPTPLVLAARRTHHERQARSWPNALGEIGELLAIARDADVFRGDDGLIYARVPHRDGHATWLLNSQDFVGWLSLTYMVEQGDVASDGDVKSAIRIIGQWCRLNGPVLPVALRVAECAHAIWLDLGDETGAAVAITREGWRVIDTPPVCFRRPVGLQALPRPESGGSLTMLGRHFNVDEDDCLLLTAWLLGCLRPSAPQVILALASAQGSAKSTTAALLGRLIDPGAALLEALPGSEKALLAAADQRHLLAFDNASSLTLAMSDALCRISTGAGRVMQVDKLDVAGTLRRPVILTGIPDLIRRPDLADRTLRIRLAPIEGIARRTDADVRAAFAADHPRLLGALLDAAAVGLRRLPEGKEPLPRMADFARWVLACAPAFSDPGRLRTLLQANALSVSGDLLFENPLGAALCRLLGETPEWAGTASRLLAALRQVAPRGGGKLPATPERLSRGLSEIEEDLRRHGIRIEKRRAGKSGERQILLTRTLPDGRRAEASEDTA